MITDGVMRLDDRGTRHGIGKYEHAWCVQHITMTSITDADDMQRFIQDTMDMDQHGMLCECRVHSDKRMSVCRRDRSEQCTDATIRRQ